MKWHKNNTDTSVPEDQSSDDTSNQDSPQNLAAEMIRRKLESVEAINTNLASEHTKTTLDPKHHGSHITHSTPSEAPAVIDPAKIVKSTATSSYHDSQYTNKTRSAFSKVTAIAPPQVLHKSSEKLKKIKPPKEFIEAQKEALEQTKTQEAPAFQKQQAISRESDFPAQRTTKEPVASSTATQIQQEATNSHQQAEATQATPEQPTISKYSDRPNAVKVEVPQETASTGAYQNQVHAVQTKPSDTSPTQTPERSSTLSAKAPTARAPKIGFKRPIMIALILGFAIMILNYNEIAVAQVKQYITPSSVISTPVITDPSQQIEVGGEARIVIPKINVDAPVVYDVTSFEEEAIQEGLERGVVHYGTTALPGEVGNNVIVGHSSNNFFNGGEHKFAFVLLDRLENGDTFALNYQGQRYVYEVFRKVEIEANDFSVVQPTNEPITTLITCSPPGTSWRRLAIQARQILPDPTSAQTQQGPVQLPDIEGPVPGNPESFWSRIF